MSEAKTETKDLGEGCYPKWLYHKTLEAKIVNSKEEHVACGKEWSEVPFEKTEQSETEEKQEEQASSYHEHMEKWPSKKEKKDKPSKAKGE